MHPRYLFAASVCFPSQVPAALTSTPPYFNLTAISAINNVSLFQCWQLTTPIASSVQNGLVGSMVQSLGVLGGNATYSYLPANFPGSAHAAPAPQYVVFLSGKMIVTVPNTTEKAIFTGGPNSVIIAADTADKSTVGHVTGTLGEPVTALQIPFLGGKIPPYSVLYNGVCKSRELMFD
ncbi:small secreted protein [Rutstroemia sp. NJR-2017a BVV2]|nr:small secreted protein [Rutstroemia sp. NJR-2017a BVV2]